jgi:hypothetical protein
MVQDFLIKSHGTNYLSKEEFEVLHAGAPPLIKTIPHEKYVFLGLYTVKKADLKDLVGAKVTIYERRDSAKLALGDKFCYYRAI